MVIEKISPNIAIIHGKRTFDLSEKEIKVLNDCLVLVGLHNKLKLTNEEFEILHNKLAGKDLI